MQSSPPCADLLPDGCMELQIQGNIAVKAPPIRLLALCTAVHEGPVGFGCRIAGAGMIVLHRTMRAD
jgi:hypothetical protein